MALQSTDWREHAIVDLVTYAPATSLGFEDDQQRIEVYRYTECAPPPETYGTPERSVRVERVTRPLYEGHV